MKKPVAIEIGGQRYQVKGADEAHAKRIAAFVNERLKEVAKRVRSASTQSHLVLTLLNVVDELLASDARRRAIEEATRDTVTKVLHRLDEQIGGGTS